LAAPKRSLLWAEWLPEEVLEAVLLDEPGQPFPIPQAGSFWRKSGISSLWTILAGMPIERRAMTSGCNERR
jgi:hypothetical protein